MADDNDIFRDMWDDFYGVLAAYEDDISEDRKKQLATVAFSTLVHNYALLNNKYKPIGILPVTRVVMMAVLYHDGFIAYRRAVRALPHSVLEEIKARLKESELK